MDTTSTDNQIAAAQAIVGPAFRDALKLGGAYLVAHGAATSSQVSFWSGLAVIVGGVVWSATVSWWKHQQLTAAKAATPGAKT